jgi:diguanylate cyclase (GGDEF)-like protein/PAS domain S-box-containing protein
MARATGSSLAGLGAFIESLRDAVLGVDEQGTIQVLNQQAKTLFGYDRHELTGQPIEILVPRHARGYFADRRNRPMGAELCLAGRRKDGTEFPADISLSSIATDGAIIVLAAVRDLSDREKAKGAIRESEARASAILQSSLDCVISMDHEGRIVEFNPAAEATFGYRREEAIGRPMADLIVPPSLRESHRRGLAQYLATGEGPLLGTRIETTGMRADGTEFPAEVAITRVDIPGAPLFTGYLRDITERNRAQEAIASLAAMVNSSHDAIIGKTPDGLVTSWNPAAERMFGIAASEAIGRTVDIIVPADRLEEERSILSGIAAGEAVPAFETKRVRKDGSVLDVSTTISPILDEAGAVIGASAIIRDISEAKRSEAALRESEERYRTLVETSPDAIVVTDVGTTIVMANQRAAEMLRCTSAEDLLGGDALELIAPEDRGRAIEDMMPMLGTGTVRNVGYTLLRMDGATFPGELSASVLRDADGDGVGFIWVVRDVTDRTEAEEQIAYLAYHDKLTGLPNRAKFEELVEMALERARRNNVAVAVLYLDLNNFKLINDSLGHTAGDELLRQVAARLVASSRVTDTVARLGGDEFLVLAPDLDGRLQKSMLEAPGYAVSVAEVLAARIKESLKAPFLVGDSEVYVSASIGISIHPFDAEDGPGLLTNADAAMYISKKVGPGRYVLSPAGSTDAKGKLSFITRLQRAVQERQWRLHYQPIVHLTSGRVVGVEALLRWHDPERGLVLPDLFLPLAEEMGLMEPIGEWLMEELARQSRTWWDEGLRIDITFNLSARQLWHHELVERLVAWLDSSGMDPRGVVIEITESAAMTDPDRTQQIMGSLANRGFRFAVDDFGTGYSSLGRLKELPFDVMKIDRSFVGDVVRDEESEAMVEAIVQLAWSLGMSSLAEGIETEGQCRVLVEQGCELGQGFYFGKAVPGEDIPALCEQGFRLPSPP